VRHWISGTRIGRPLHDAAQSRAGDEAAVASGDTWSALMDRAAGHLARGVVRVAGRQVGLQVVVVVGKGNNGGDGWAAARRLRDLDADVVVASVVPTDTPMSDEAAAHRRAWLESGGHTVVGVTAIDELLGDPDPDPADQPDVVVDCLLGTGIDGAPRGDVGQACVAINTAHSHRVTVVACDVPSGVASDTGAAPGDAVHADATVTMGEVKRGLVLHPGAAHAGLVLVGDLGRHHEAPDRDEQGHLWTRFDAHAAEPEPLDPAADKLARGRTLVVAGSVGTAGAAVLATRGALWSGAGLTTLATPAHVQRVIAPVVPSAMTRPLRHQQEHVGPDAVAQLDDVHDFDAVAAGPGLGPTDGTRAVVDHLRRHARRLVLDADAINVHRDDPAALADHAGALVLTPHERELARLGVGRDGADAWAHRVERLPQLAADLDAVIVAKGPGTIVADPSGWCTVVPVGGPELGTGGTGDVLAGMIAAHVASAPVDRPGAIGAAVARAVFLHAFTGAWLSLGRPRAEALVRRLDPPAGHTLASDGVPGPTVVGFGPSSALPEAVPAAARVLSRVVAIEPRWPLAARA
jgi:hydroxyethylthiazole kinase-like uncharacterized protein yjeF